MSGDPAQTRDTHYKIALDRVGRIQFVKDGSQYDHNAAVKYVANVERVLRNSYNQLDSDHGMAKLLDEAKNAINSIKSTTAYTADDVLASSKAEAKKISAAQNITAVPKYNTRADAQEHADRLNVYSQAVVGYKEGVVEALLNTVGSDVLNAALIDVDGTSPKGLDDYKLADLTKLIIEGANRPQASDVLTQVIQLLTMPWDHRKKVATNVEILRSKSAQIQAYGIDISVPLIVLIIFRNIEQGQQHEWGREYRPAMQSIRADFPYSHKHDETSLNKILQHLAAADSVRPLKEAPEPESEPASANSVSEDITLLQQLMQSAKNYEKTAYAAAETDSESSIEERRHRKTKTSRRDRSETNRRDRSGRSKSSNRRHRTRSRPRRDAEDKPKNKCPHCKKYRPRVWGTHDANACFYNKAYKGYRPLQVCGELGIVFKKRDKFPKALGGYSDSSGESESE